MIKKEIIMKKHRSRKTGERLVRKNDINRIEREAKLFQLSFKNFNEVH
jgi:hypothetical protein